MSVKERPVVSNVGAATSLPSQKTCMVLTA
jgi:hypothetical protein